MDIKNDLRRGDVITWQVWDSSNRNYYKQIGRFIRYSTMHIHMLVQRGVGALPGASSDRLYDDGGDRLWIKTREVDDPDTVTVTLPAPETSTQSFRGTKRTAFIVSITAKGHRMNPAPKGKHVVLVEGESQREVVANAETLADGYFPKTLWDRTIVVAKVPTATLDRVHATVKGERK